MEIITLTKPNECPVCHKKLNAATCVEEEERTPVAGDISVCLYCATLLEFQGDLTIKPISDGEMSSVLSREQVALVRKAQHHIKQRNEKDSSKN